jgi:hypothetical protein
VPEKVKFVDPTGRGKAIELTAFEVPADIPDHDQRAGKIPEPDPNYVDLGMLYRLAAIEQVRRAGLVDTPLHLALRGHMGTGKDHDLEQFAAMLRMPYYRIPLTGEVRDITLIGSVKLHGDGRGGTESRWEDGDITRALRGPALINLSELNAAGAETLFALHALLDRYQALDLPTGETVKLRDDTRIFGTLNPTDLRRNSQFAIRNSQFAIRNSQFAIRQTRSGGPTRSVELRIANCQLRPSAARPHYLLTHGSLEPGRSGARRSYCRARRGCSRTPRRCRLRPGVGVDRDLVQAGARSGEPR